MDSDSPFYKQDEVRWVRIFRVPKLSWSFLKRLDVLELHYHHHTQTHWIRICALTIVIRTIYFGIILSGLPRPTQKQVHRINLGGECLRNKQ